MTFLTELRTHLQVNYKSITSFVYVQWNLYHFVIQGRSYQYARYARANLCAFLKKKVKKIYSCFYEGCRIKCTRQFRKVHCFSKKFERMAREAMEICLWVLKESNKSRLDSYSVRNIVLNISHITSRDCRVHIFSDNLSQNNDNLTHLVKQNK